MTVDEELVCWTVARLMSEVRWSRDAEEDPRRFITTSRRVKLFSEVDANEQPACFQAEWGTTEEQRSNLPYKSSVDIRWIIYQCVARDDAALGTVENNLILRGIREALAPKIDDPGYADKRNTLGGLVHHCFLSGTIFKDPGDIDKQGMLVVPIKVLVP